MGGESQVGTSGFSNIFPTCWFKVQAAYITHEIHHLSPGSPSKAEPKTRTEVQVDGLGGEPRKQEIGSRNGEPGKGEKPIGGGIPEVISAGNGAQVPQDPQRLPSKKQEAGDLLRQFPWLLLEGGPQESSFSPTPSPCSSG